MSQTQCLAKDTVQPLQPMEWPGGDPSHTQKHPAMLTVRTRKRTKKKKTNPPQTILATAKGRKKPEPTYQQHSNGKTPTTSSGKPTFDHQQIWTQRNREEMIQPDLCGPLDGGQGSLSSGGTGTAAEREKHLLQRGRAPKGAATPKADKDHMQPA